jgi:phage gpG-like protein
MPRIKRMEFPDFSKKATTSGSFFRKLPTLAGNMALNFFQDSWDREGFIDQRYKRWPDRKKSAGRKSRKLLVKSGRLRRSLRMQVSGSRIRIFTDVPYAEAHNEGTNISGSFRIRAHKRRLPGGGTTTVRSHARQVNIKIPQRQFMGHSALLDKRLEMHVTRALNQIF